MSVVIPFAPEWGFSETYEYQTQILRTITSEQRIATRLYPRLSVAYDYVLDSSLQPWAHQLLRNGIREGVQIPLWSMVESTVERGVIFKRRNPLSYWSDGVENAIFYIDDDNHTLSLIGNPDIVADNLYFDTVFARDVSGMGYQMWAPLKNGSFKDSISYGRDQYGTFKFGVTVDCASANFTRLFNDTNSLVLRYGSGARLLAKRPNTITTFNTELNLERETFDSSIGLKSDILAKRKVSEAVHSMGYQFSDQQSVFDMLSFFNERLGGQKPFYFPTFDGEIKLTGVREIRDGVWSIEKHPKLNNVFNKQVYFELKKSCRDKHFNGFSFTILADFVKGELTVPPGNISFFRQMVNQAVLGVGHLCNIVCFDDKMTITYNGHSDFRCDFGLRVVNDV